MLCSCEQALHVADSSFEIIDREALVAGGVFVCWLFLRGFIVVVVSAFWGAGGVVRIGAVNFGFFGRIVGMESGGFFF